MVILVGSLIAIVFAAILLKASGVFGSNPSKTAPTQVPPITIDNAIAELEARRIINNMTTDAYLTLSNGADQQVLTLLLREAETRGIVKLASPASAIAHYVVSDMRNQLKSY